MLRWVVGVVFGVEALYVVAANLALAFGGVQAAFASSGDVKADFTRAWSVWPGVIHVENLKVTIQDHNIQSLIGLDRAVVTVRLRELPKKVFHATRLRGTGVFFRFRNRVQPEDAGRPYVAALPPIPGMENPPVFEARVPPPPIPDAKYDLWTVHIEDVDVGVRELWVQQFRYLGKARARGKFELKPARHLWVGPEAVLDLSPGRLLVGPSTPFLDRFRGRITCTVHWFDVRIPSGREVLEHISTHLALSGQVASMEVVRLFTDPAAAVRVDQQGAGITVDARVDHGVVLPGSRFRLAGDGLDVRLAATEFAAAGPWSLDGSVEAGRPGGKVAVDVARATLGRDGMAPGRRVRIEDLHGALSSTTMDTSTDWGISGGEIGLGRAVLPDLAATGELLPPLPVRFTGGSGSASGNVAFEGEKIRGEGEARLAEAVGVVADNEIRGSIEVAVSRGRYDAGSGAYAADARFHARSVSLDDVKRRKDCPFARVQAADLRAAVQGVGARVPLGSVEGTVDGASLRWGDVTLDGSADVRAEAERSPERLVKASARATAVRLSGGTRWVVRAPKVAVNLAFEGTDSSLHGPVRLDANGASGSVGKVRMQGDLSAALRVSALDVGARTGVALGALRVHAARLWSGDKHVEDWWARAELGPVLVDAKTNLDMDGPAKVKLRDGLPGLLALSEADKLPGWLPEVLPLNGLGGVLEIHRHCRTTDVVVPGLSGGPLAASGRISMNPDETRGAFLVRLGLLSAGITLGGSDSGVSLFAGEDWLRKQVDAVERDGKAHVPTSCESPPSQTCER